MTEHVNLYGQPVGEALPLWSARAFPARITLTGHYCRVEPLCVARHIDALYAAYAAAPDGRDWTYMFVGPFRDKEAYRAYLTATEQQQDSQCYVVIDTLTDNAVGTFSLMRVDVNNGVIEVGSVAFSPSLKRTPLATEAHFLLMGYVFEQLHYRRYEWKCDSLNAPSRRAALLWGLPLKAFSVRLLFIKDVRVTLPGSPCWIMSGHSASKIFSIGWRRVTSILKENRSNRWPRSDGLV